MSELEYIVVLGAFAATLAGIVYIAWMARELLYPLVMHRFARVERRGRGYVGWIRKSEYYSVSGYVWFRKADDTEAPLRVWMTLNDAVERRYPARDLAPSAREERPMVYGVDDA